MGKFSGLLICSDFDGTMAIKKSVSPANADAVRYFQEHGGRFTLATGRPPSILQDNQGTPFTCNTHLICMNGALIYDPLESRPIRERLVPTEKCTDVIMAIAREAVGLRDVILFPTYSWKQTFFDPRQTDEIARMLKDPLYKIVIHVDDEQSDPTRDRLIRELGESISVYRSWLNGIELNAADANKGAAARSLATMLGVDMLIGIGDYENDLPLIEQADVGYAMGNASDVLKQAADRVADTVENDGFAKIIYSL